MTDRTLVKDVDQFLEVLKNQPKSEPPKPELSFRLGADFWPETTLPKRAHYIAFIVQYFNEYRELPSKSDFERRFSEEDLPKSVSEWKEFLLELAPLLQNHGVPPY